MRISTNGFYQKQELSNDGYSEREVDDEKDLGIIARFDWSPSVYKDGYRDGAHWLSSQFLFADIDNDPWDSVKGIPVKKQNPVGCKTINQWNCSLAEFYDVFNGIEFYILTSRNNKKEKFSKKGKCLIEPSERFHVLFPLTQPCSDQAKLRAALRGLTRTYKFMDKAVTDPTRFFYGFDAVECLYHKGEKINIDIYADMKEKSTRQEQAQLTLDKVSSEKAPAFVDIPKPEIVITEDEFDEMPDYLKGLDKSKYHDFDVSELTRQFTEYSEQDKRVEIMKALRVAASVDALHDYDDWIRLGHAMKMEGYTVDDWRELSYENIPDIDYKWASFVDYGSATGGTVLWFAREGNPNCLKKGVTKDEKRTAVSMVNAKINEIAQKKECPKDGQKKQNLGEMITCLMDHPGDAKIKRIKNLLASMYSNKNGVIKDGFTLRAIAEADDDFDRFCYFDEATGYPKFSPKLRSIDEVDISIWDRCMIYGLEVSTAMRKDFLESHMLRHTFNSMENLVNKLIEENPENGVNHLDKFCSYLNYKAFKGNEIEKNPIYIGYYKAAWDIFFTKMAMRMLSSFRTDKVPNDYVIALTGNEGIGKSYFCQWIALNEQDFFIDYGTHADIPLGSPDSIRLIRGKLIIELGEGSFAKKTDDLTFKAIVSATVDKYREMYKRGTTTTPRTGSMIITSNPEEILRSTNGNRRVTPMPIHSIDWSYAKDKTTMPMLIAHYLRKATVIMDQGRSGEIRETEDLKEFFDFKRIRSVDVGIWGDYIHDFIIELEKGQFDNVIRSKNSTGRKKSFMILTNRMITDKLMEKGLNLPNDIKGKIKTITSGLGYEPSQSVEVINGEGDKIITSGYKMQIFVDEKREKIIPRLIERHQEPLIQAVLSQY